MICEHKGNGETAWLPFEYHERDRGHMAHLVCSECGLVKDYVLRQTRALDVRLWRSEGLTVSVAGENSMQEAFQRFLGTFEFSDGHFRAITMNHFIKYVLDQVELPKEGCRMHNIKLLWNHAFGQHWCDQWGWTINFSPLYKLYERAPGVQCLPFNICGGW